MKKSDGREPPKIVEFLKTVREEETESCEKGPFLDKVRFFLNAIIDFEENNSKRQTEHFFAMGSSYCAGLEIAKNCDVLDVDFLAECFKQGLIRGNSRRF